MTDSEKLDLLLAEMQGMKSEMQGMKSEMQGLNQKVAGINLHLENVTDKNIQTLAENHLSLIDKLNEAVKVADKDLIYEIQVRILNEKVEKMEKEIAELKNRIA